MKLLKICT